MAEIDWSALPNDALEAISDLLTFDPDHIRFRSVCTSWRSAAPRRGPHLPWLIGHRKDGDGNHTLFSFFRFSPAGDEIVPIAELPESPLFGGMPCRGSSHGWMALLDFAGPSIVLFNPLTKTKIQLPELPIITEIHDSQYRKDGEGEYRSSFVGEVSKRLYTKILSFTETEYYLASQVVLSSDPAVSSDFIAMAVCGCRTRLAFCRAGDEAWTLIDSPKGGNTTQILLYKGQFYVVCYGTVYVCRLGLDPKLQIIASISREDSGFPQINESHLVKMDGDLLLVLAFHPYGKKGYEFMVFRVEFGEPVRLVRVESLGCRALFLGLNHSFSVPTTQLQGCRGNCIYYTQVYFAEELAKSFRVFDLKDGSNAVIPYDSALPHPDWKPCIWFTPNLLSASHETGE